MTTYHSYSDGNYFPRAKKSGFGGYIVDPHGQVLVEYSEQIKQSEYVYNFELLGIIRGLTLAKENKIDNIISHCDDKNTTSRLKEIFENNTFKIPSTAKPELYEKIIELSKSFKKISFEYIPRTENKYADSLSRRYAVLMENNFHKHYHNELDIAQEKFASAKFSKRLFFSHPSMVRNPNKNNPFLVAPHRNRKVRKLSKSEEDKQYDFLFIETFNKEDSHIMRAFFYDPQKKVKQVIEKKFSQDNEHLDTFNFFLAECLDNVNNNNVWIFSNFSEVNSILEQREKINKNADKFLNLFNKMSKFDNVFYHHFPFEHEFSPEIATQVKKVAKLHETYDDLDIIMEQLSKGVEGREQNKCFGNLIRHHLREYQKQIQRELEDTEKMAIIEKTTENLTKLGYQVPQFLKH